MVLTDAAVNTLRDLAWQLEASDAVVKIPRFPLYVVDERRAFLDLGLANCEAWGWPNRPGYSFVKAMEWEQPVLPREVQRIVLPDWSCVELKYLDADEFDHWSDTDFDTTLAHPAQAPRVGGVPHARRWRRAARRGGPGRRPRWDPRHRLRALGVAPKKASDPGDLAERILRQLVRL